MFLKYFFITYIWTCSQTPELKQWYRTRSLLLCWLGTTSCLSSHHARGPVKTRVRVRKAKRMVIRARVERQQAKRRVRARVARGRDARMRNQKMFPMLVANARSWGVLPLQRFLLRLRLRAAEEKVKRRGHRIPKILWNQHQRPTRPRETLK